MRNSMWCSSFKKNWWWWWYKKWLQWFLTGILNALFLELILCAVLAPYKIEAHILIQPSLFIPEWPHWSLNSKGFLCHIRIYPIMEQRFNLGFGNLKFIFQRIHLQHLQHCKNVSVLTVFSLSWYSYFKYILILGFSM